MTDITPTGPAKPTQFDISTFDGAIRWTSANSLALFKAARAAQEKKLTAALSSPPVKGAQRAAANRRETTLKAEIIRFKRAIDKIENDFRNGNITSSQRALRLYTQYSNLSAASAELEVIQAQVRETVSPRDKVAGKTTGKKPRETEQKKPPVVDNRLRYNVGSVSEAYFTSRTEFLLEKANTDKLGSAVEGNRPSPALNSALELWNNGKSSKGMFITWRDISTGFDDKSADSQSRGFAGTNEKLPPHAFRFQYNPGSISMAYAGTPLVDPNFEAAGLDKFNLTGTGVTQSTITFQLLINRMYDMKYYTREDEQIPDGEGGVNPPGVLKPGAGNVYGEEFVSLETQRAIYNMGTMYDFEFLLRTIMGYTMKSALRDYSFFNDGGTADMGFLGARPVELHLGKNMRYLGYITNINVEHVIFDSRMVPLFSNISIAFSRLPDYVSPNRTPLTGEPSPAVNKGGFVGSEDYRRSLTR